MNVQDDSSTIFVDYRICFTEQNVTFFFSFSEIVKAVYWLKFVEFLKKEKNHWKNQQPKAVKRLVKYEKIERQMSKWTGFFAYFQQICGNLKKKN